MVVRQRPRLGIQCRFGGAVHTIMAGASAQFLAPWIGGGLIGHFGYEALFIVAAFITLLCGLSISMIRRAP